MTSRKDERWLAFAYLPLIQIIKLDMDSVFRA